MNTEQTIAKMLDRMVGFRRDAGFIGDMRRTLDEARRAHTKLVEFAKWCVDNWQCDGWPDETYTEKFCNSPQCRRCSAKRILESIAE